MNTLRKNPQRRQNAAVALRIVVVLGVLAVLALGMFLIPSERSVAKRLIADRAGGRLVELTKEKLGRDDGEAALLTYLGEVLHDEDWHSQRVFDGLLDIAERAGDPAAIFNSLRNERNIPEDCRAGVAVSLALRSEKSGDEELAGRIHAYALETMPPRPEALLLLVRAYRKAAKPALAFQLIEHFVSEHGNESFPDEFQRIRQQLALETNHPGRAFEMALQDWNEDDSGTERDDRLDALSSLAEAASRTNDVIPLLEDRVSGNPVMSAAPGAIRPGMEGEPAILRFGAKLATYYEWAGRPGDAFEVHARLALLGDPVARQRCRALNAGLFRGEELKEVLSRNEAQLDLDERVQLADLMRTSGSIEEAERIYGDLIDKEPARRAEFQSILGYLLDENGRPEDAIPLLKAASAANPGDSATAGKLGDILVRLGKYDEALAHFSSMPHHDRESATAFYHLASAVGDDQAACEALRLRLTATKEPLATDYLELVEEHAELGEFEEADRVLGDGLKRFPRSRQILLRYVSMLGGTFRQDEALELILSSPDLAGDPAAIGRMEQLSIGEKDYARVLRWMGGVGVEEREDLSNEGKALVAGIYLKMGLAARARTLAASLPELPEFVWLKATIAFADGRFRDAERLQSIYVAGAGRSVADAWRQLGRFKRALGRQRDAQECFGMALSLITEKMHASLGRAPESTTSISNGED